MGQSLFYPDVWIQPEDVIGDLVQNILRGPNTRSYDIYKLHHGILKGKGVSKLELTYYDRSQQAYDIRLTAIPVMNADTKQVDQFIIYQKECELAGWKKVWLFRKFFAMKHRYHGASVPNWEPMKTQKIPLDESTGLLMTREQWQEYQQQTSRVA